MSPPAINITVPAYNEELLLADSIRRLSAFAQRALPWPYEIVIADNGSIDRTLEIARNLTAENAHVRVLHLDRKGRGRALKTAWLGSSADVLCYMDADLSTDLEHLPALLDALVTRGYDLAIGSRLLRPELTTRCFKRELTSRGYNSLVHGLLHTHFSDTQCGFKAITRQAAQVLLPLVQDNNWFFDTELLVLAERWGYRVFELPVRWVENRRTHVKILRTAAEDLRGLLRLRYALGGVSMSRDTASPVGHG